MKIRTLWHDERDGGPPWLVAACDLYSVDHNGELPDDYARELTKHADRRRELIIEVSTREITDLFKIPGANGMVVGVPIGDD